MGQSQVVTESQISCLLLNNSFIKKALILSYIWLEGACEVLYYGMKFIWWYGNLNLNWIPNTFNVCSI